MRERVQRKCPSFNTCGAEVIREHRGENWHQRFCFADFKNCVHYQDRIQITAFITKEGKKVKLHPKQ